MTPNESILLEAKNRIAIQKGYPSWKEMEDFIIDHNTLTVVVAQLLVGAMEEAATEAIKKWEDSSGKETGMKWVRASERLPDEKKPVMARLIGTCIYYSWEEIWMKRNDTNLLSKIEWLDESVPPYKDILNKMQTTEFSKVYEDYSKKLESKEEAGEDQKK